MARKKKQFSLMVTGHRPNKLPGGYNLSSPLNLELYSHIEGIVLETLAKYPDLILITGMALGVDTMFAMIGIRNKIPVHAYIPCANQSCKWTVESQNTYAELMTKVTKIVNVSDAPYTSGCMNKRNAAMVENADGVLAIWNGSPGGTKNAVYLALKSNRKIRVMDPLNYELKSLTLKS